MTTTEEIASTVGNVVSTGVSSVGSTIVGYVATTLSRADSSSSITVTQTGSEIIGSIYLA